MDDQRGNGMRWEFERELAAGIVDRILVDVGVTGATVIHAGIAIGFGRFRSACPRNLDWGRSRMCIDTAAIQCPDIGFAVGFESADLDRGCDRIVEALVYGGDV